MYFIGRGQACQSNRMIRARCDSDHYIFSVLDVLTRTHSCSPGSCGIKRGVGFPVTAKHEMRRRALVCHKVGGVATRGSAACHYLIFSFMRCASGNGRGRIVAFCVASSGGRLPIHLSVFLGVKSTGTFLGDISKGHCPLASVVSGWGMLISLCKVRLVRE